MPGITHSLTPTPSQPGVVRWQMRKPGAASPGTTITLTFASSTLSRGGGVEGNAAATNASQAFSFTEITPRSGMPADLEISESGTLKLVITFPSNYAGASYSYTKTTGGSPVSGTFPSGNGTANY